MRKLLCSSAYKQDMWTPENFACQANRIFNVFNIGDSTGIEFKVTKVK